MCTTGSLVVLAAALAGCSSGTTPSVPDAVVPGDQGTPDDGGIPAPPVLGAQLSRAGRPVVKRALIGPFADEATRAAAWQAYDRASDPASWKTTQVRPGVTIAGELAANLAVFDAIDKGLVVPNRTLAGCGNAFRYAAPPSAQSYAGGAEIFADDQLYIDTAKPTCGVYLALEIELASAGTFVHAACGGRTPAHDVVDATYSVLGSGTDALDPANGLSGRISDAVGPHSDTSESFPFLGAPH
jgi:hypothetical protein